MAENKAKPVKKYGRLLGKKDLTESGLETDRKLSEEKHDSEERLSIEDEEDAGEEAYPETEENLGYEDNADKEDEG